MSTMATFVGRQSDQHDLQALLDQHLVVTLVGPGGVGKTRLAREVADAVGDRFPGGVLFTELAGASPTDDVSSVMAHQHGLGSVEALRLAAVASPTLIVLDNCESALAGAADLAEELVADGDSIRVLATSRAPLGLYGEHRYVVAPLDVPADDRPQSIRSSAAAQLFVQRASAAGARWPLDEAHLAATGTLVRQLDGLPLAIELAAARARVLTAEELLGHLERPLEVLTRPGDPGTDRHGSVRRAIATSYEQLDADQQRLLRSLSVFAAPFDLALAHGVAGDDSELDTLDRLGELVDTSLVEARATEAGTTRYRLLDSIRAFGREQLEDLGESAVVAERYVATMVAFAEEIVAAALESFSAEVLTRIRDRFTHLVHAIEQCLDVDATPERARLLYLPMYGPMGAQAEVTTLGRRMRDRWSGSGSLEAEALAVLATATFLRGNDDEAAQVATEAVAHPGATPLALMMAERVLGFVAARSDDCRSAMEHLDAAIAVAEPFSAAFARELKASWAAVVVDRARSAEALRLLAGVTEVAAAEGEMATVLWAGMAQVHHHVLLGEFAEARRAAARIVEVSTRTGLPWSLSASHRTIAGVLALGGEWEAAAPHYLESLENTVASGDLEGVVVTLRAASGAASHLGLDDLAAALWATLPAGRGRPVIRSFFATEERRLTAELGLPVERPLARLVDEARRLLSAPAPDPTAAPDPAAAPASAHRVLRFADCELDLDLRELRRAGERVHLEPQVFDLLVLLVERRGTAVSKHEILDEVWGDRFVSDSALTTRIKAARKATGDDGRTQAVIRTVHGHGYAFVAEVR